MGGWSTYSRASPAEERQTQGWKFEHDDQVYYVGAADEAGARALVAKSNADAAKTIPQALPRPVAKFFDLNIGTVLRGGALRQIEW